jgi:hypothetical protein
MTSDESLKMLPQRELKSLPGRQVHVFVMLLFTFPKACQI